MFLNLNLDIKKNIFKYTILSIGNDVKNGYVTIKIDIPENLI